MAKLTLLLVGTHFHPPAKTLLEALPAGCPLELLAEPDNPYDENAVKCQLGPEWADWLMEQAPSVRESLEASLPNQGATLEQVLSTLPLMLGHVGASGGKPLAKAGGEAGMPTLSGNRELLEAGPNWPLPAKLAFSPAGTSIIEVELPA